MLKFTTIWGSSDWATTGTQVAQPLTVQIVKNPKGKYSMHGRIISLVVAVLIFNGALFADDTEVKSSTHTSKNPITGTVTKHKKYKKIRKSPDGSSSEISVKDTVKTKTDGKVEHTLKKESKFDSGNTQE